MCGAGGVARAIPPAPLPFWGTRAIRATRATSPMSQPAKILRPIAGELQPGERPKAVRACNDYLRMGPGRSLGKLAASIVKVQVEIGRVSGTDTAALKRRTKSVKSALERYSSAYGWVARAEMFDAALEEKRTREATRILSSGYANPHERVYQLDRLARKVVRDLDESLYMLEPKQVAGRRVDVKRFKSKQVAAARGILEDIALETGGRVKQSHIQVSGLAGLLGEAPGFDDAEEAAYTVEE